MSRAEADALTAYLDALMRPVPDAAAREPVPDDPPSEAFACLPIVVGGVTLAIPGDEVRQVLNPLVQPQSVSGHRRRPGWFAGYCEAAGRRASLVNLAVIISDGGQLAGEAKAAIVVGDGRYALACDAVLDAFDVQPDRVSWRTTRTRRPWLAGIETARRCALLDMRALARQLAAEEGILA